MAQAARITLPAHLLTIMDELEDTWPTSLAALRASGVPMCAYEDLNDEQLRARARELGLTVADDADRATVEAAIAAKEKTPAKPWGGDADFDPDKAWKLLENVRRDRADLKKRLDELEREKKDREDAAKTEEQRREEARQAAEAEAKAAKIEAARLRVALKKNLTESQAKRLVGETEEELEADADELLATFASGDGDGQEPPTGRPRERTPRSGTAIPASEPEETNPKKLAAMIPRRF